MSLESAVYAVISACVLVFGVAEAVTAAADGSWGLGLLELAITISVAGFLALRMARLGVFVEPDGIRVRNPLKTSTISWRDVRGITLHRSAIGEFGIVDLHDGRRIRLWGIQPRNRIKPARDRRAELAIGRLNRELQAARSAVPLQGRHT
jgi:hypothetical protein